jgi:hypothetical protein
MLQTWGRRGLAWLVAALTATLLASLGHSIMVQAGLRGVGARIPLLTGLWAMVRDFLGLLPALGGILAGATLAAFLVAGLLKGRVPGWLAPLAYPLAGLVAVAAALLAMRFSFGFSPLAGARGPGGFLLMSAGGLVAGFLFARLLPKAAQAKKASAGGSVA